MWQRILRIIFLLMGLVILAFSIIRTTLITTINDEKNDRLRNVPIKTDIINREGEWENINYKFPETGVLPSSPFYFLKSFRDYIWISFTRNPIDKSRMMLLTADKQMEEVILMTKQKANKQIIIKTTIEATNKLKLASEELKKDQSNRIENQHIQNQINKTIYVYKKIIQTLEIEEEEKQELTWRVEEIFK
ncbi:MAG: DUF5667 domain-containing protein [Candidatus Shapirobacteria bacterium]|jgi:hypothetical protein